MHLLVGLGNVGREYETTRHNFGFLLLDCLVDKYKLAAQGKKFKSEIFSGEISGKKILALKPQTFMNLSGQAVIEAANFYKIPSEKIIVLHDDVDLEMGRIKVKIGGGHGGHNGLKSLDEAVGKNYVRIRLGVGRPANKEYSTADYVLGKFTKEELQQVEKINLKIAENFGEILEGKLDGLVNKFYL